jgi:hypothetical protein
METVERDRCRRSKLLKQRFSAALWPLASTAALHTLRGIGDSTPPLSELVVIYERNARSAHP